VFSHTLSPSHPHKLTETQSSRAAIPFDSSAFQFHGEGGKGVEEGEPISWGCSLERRFIETPSIDAADRLEPSYLPTIE